MINKSKIIGTILLVSILNLIVQSTQILNVNATSSLEDMNEKMKRDLEKTQKDTDKRMECSLNNTEKSQFYSSKGKFYQSNYDCDPDKQPQIDRINKMRGIDEYKDFPTLSNYDQEEESDIYVSNNDDQEEEEENNDNN